MKTPLALSIYSLAAAVSCAGTPEPQTERWLDGDYALGTWGGLRSQLAQKGISFDSYYVNNIAGNPIGGTKTGGFTYTDNFYLGISLDLDKLVGWSGATFAISGINRDGLSLTERYVGSQYNSQQVFGGQNIFLYNFTLEQTFWDGKARFKLGRFGASDDFNGSPIYGLYMNNGIDGNIRNVLFNTQFSAYPFATWATRLRLDPTPEINAQLGVFQTWNNVFDRSHNGLDWSIRGNDGVFLIAQLGWSPEFFKKPAPPDSKNGVATTIGLPGHYWVGGSFSPWNGYTQFGKPGKTGNSYGFYLHADQMVFQEAPGSDQGLTLMAAAGYYPQENIAIIPFQVNIGATYTGLLPNRDHDKTIFGMIHGRFGSDYADTVRVSGAGYPSTETVFELGYRYQITRFAYIQPDLQWILRPGGTGNVSDAVVLGAQIGITF